MFLQRDCFSEFFYQVCPLKRGLFIRFRVFKSRNRLFQVLFSRISCLSNLLNSVFLSDPLFSSLSLSFISGRKLANLYKYVD